MCFNFWHIINLLYLPPGAITIVILLPSSFGITSILNFPVSICEIFSKTFIPEIRPGHFSSLRNIMTFALLPSSRKRLIFLTFNSRSCISIWGLIFYFFYINPFTCSLLFTQLIFIFTKVQQLADRGGCFRRYLYQVKVFSTAITNASLTGITPTCFPSPSISLTSFALICSFTLMFLLIPSPPYKIPAVQNCQS